MDQIKELQEQIEALKKTVDDLKAGTTKVTSTKDIVRNRENEIFNRYFLSYQDFSVDDNRPRNGANTDRIKTDVKELAKIVYKYNTEQSDKNILYLLGQPDQLEKYLEVYESYCQLVCNTLTNDKLKAVKHETY